MTEDWIWTITTTKGIEDKQVKADPRLLLSDKMTSKVGFYGYRNPSINPAMWKINFAKTWWWWWGTRGTGSNIQADCIEISRQQCRMEDIVSNNSLTWYKTCWLWFMEQLSQTCLGAADVSSVLSWVRPFEFSLQILQPGADNKYFWWCGWSQMMESHVFLYLH